MSKATETLQDTPDGIARAAELLRAGQLVAFPSETVYGLGADARRPDAVAAIFAAKGRPSTNPLIVHVRDLEAATRIVDLPADGHALAQAFWPGALTLVARARPDAGLAPAVQAGHPTVAVRVPAHPVLQALLRAADLPLAGPSANRSGRVSPTSAEHVLDELSGRIAAVLDAGPCPVGVESTIVAVEETTRLLRPGGLPLSAIEACLGRPITAHVPTTDSPSAPGQFASHYAPEARLHMNVTDPSEADAFLGFGPGADATLNLSPSGDLAEAASNLFDFLRKLDAAGHATIGVAPIPETGLGLAINDRLRRAAAPRPG